MYYSSLHSALLLYRISWKEFFEKEFTSSHEHLFWNPDLKPRNCQIYTKVVPAKSSCVGLTMQI